MTKIACSETYCYNCPHYSLKILSNYGKNETYTDLYNSYEFNYMNNIITKEL